MLTLLCGGPVFSGGSAGKFCYFALYCCSLTSSIQVTFLPSFMPVSAMCVMAVVGEAPCPHHLRPGLVVLRLLCQDPGTLHHRAHQGLGQAVADKKIIETALDELSKITGQKAVTTKSKKDISNFKLRKGMTIGARVTLRHNKMYEFLERLVAVALPRIRDFKGINDKFDGQGNYTLGITEQIIFPEIDIDKITKILGMEITFVTSAATDEEAYALLKQFGLPFKNIKKN